jgi:integrase/recombinase XerD
MEKQISRFLAQLESDRGFSNNTISAYRNDLTQFHAFVSNHRSVQTWPELTDGHLTDYVLHLRDREYARSTIARKVAAVKSFCHHLVDDGVLRADPTEKLASPRVDKFTPKAISEREIEQLLNKPCESNAPEALRDKAMLETLYSTGMRVTELTSLDVGDIDLSTCEVQCGKRPDRQRLIPLRHSAIESLTTYLTDGRPKLRVTDADSALFLNHRGKRLTRQGFWLILKSYAEAVGINDLTPHTIRHSFALHELARGRDVRDIQKIMGHMSLSTTQVYQQLVGSDGLLPDSNSSPVTAAVANAERSVPAGSTDDT